MTDNALSTTLAAFLISPVELILIFLALIAVPATIIAIVFFVIWLVRRNHKQPPAPSSFPPPPLSPTGTKRFCPQCGKEMSPDAPQGLCPSCLMQVALGTQSGEPPKRDTPKPPLPAPSELAARFPQLEILELLGQGGMGAVYKARQKNLDRFVALKVLPAQAASDPGFTERFNREARALAKLSHPNIVGVYEYGQADGIPFFIMEFIDGVNLRQLQQAGKLEPREALKIIPQICEALQFAHDEGIVHRDIKPENVLLDKKGRAKIADFGLARILGREPSAFRLTGARDIMGTPHYMAPEQIEKPQTVDHRADIYSLGVVFYEMLTGELPLGRFAPPSEKVQLDVRLDEVVLKTLEKEPGRRYQHVGEVKTRIETITSQPGVAPAPVQPSWVRGVDYKSKRTIFGMPFVHVATGIDPLTGRTRVARGFIAIGGVAQGVFAFGGVAMGIFAFGGLSLGLFAYGGLALGLLAIGGLAIALLGASGGLAIAPIALGGGAIGYFAKGGYAIATHRLDAVVRDPVAVDFFTPWASNWNSDFQIFNMALFILTILIVTIIPPWLQRRSNHQDRQGVPRRGGAILFTALTIGLVILGLVGIGVWTTWEAIKRPAQQRQQAARTTLQLSMADQIRAKLAAQQVQFSDIHFNYDAESPRIRVMFSGLRSSRDAAKGLRDINGELLLQFNSPDACNATGSGDLSFFKDRFKVTNNGFFWWNQKKGEQLPATPKIPYELGPIIERTVTYGEVNPDGLAFVNLEKAEIMPSPFTVQVDVTTAPILVHNTRIDEWIAASGMDLAIHLKETNWAWAPLGAQTLFVEDEASFQLENVTLEQAERVLTDTRSRKGTYVVHGAGMSAYPITASYIFKTREGTVGLVELAGFTNAVNGVKIRYRLAQPVAPPVQTSVAPQSSKPGELEFRLVAADGDTNTPADELADPNDRTGQTKLRVLKEVLLDSSAVTSANLETNAPPGAGTTISVHMNDPQKLERITTTNLSRRLAIVWRGRVLSAPVIRTPITGHVISINGNLSDAETIVLLDLLNYQFDPDVIRKLKISREELEKLRAKYTDAYPAVQDKRRAVEALEKAAIRR